MSQLTLTQQASAPAAPVSSKAVLFVDTAGHFKVRLPDGSILDAMALAGDYVDLSEASAPATPDTGHARLFVDTADQITKLVLSDGSVVVVGSQGTATIAIDYNYARHPDTVITANNTPYGWGGPELVADEIDRSGAIIDTTTDGYALLHFDLGSVQSVAKVVIRHAEAAGYPSNSDYNARDYTIEWSDDDSTWTTQNTVTGNATLETAYSYAPALAHRYWRIKITNPNNSIDTLARVQEVQIVVPQPADLYLNPWRQQFAKLGDGTLVSLADSERNLLVPDGQPVTGNPPAGFAYWYSQDNQMYALHADGTSQRMTHEDEIPFWEFPKMQRGTATAFTVAASTVLTVNNDDTNTSALAAWAWDTPGGDFPFSGSDTGEYRMDIGADISFDSGRTTGGASLVLVTSGTMRKILDIPAPSGAGAADTTLSLMVSVLRGAASTWKVELHNDSDADLTVNSLIVSAAKVV